tara:strand:+ start:476 stop:1897 length:1422 start_codon:yes stop_codon:yes gene_type:complete
MIFTIQINFVQIGGSLGMSMDVPWPGVYTEWMNQLAFVAEFDVLAMLGVTCLPGMTYELKFISSTAIVFGVVLLVGIIYCCKRSALNSRLKNISEKQRIDSANHLFTTVDLDLSNSIDMEEFQLCLSQIAGRKTRNTQEELSKIMMSLGAKIPEGEHHYEPEMNRKQFVQGILSGKLAGKDSNTWIRFLEKDRLKSAYVAVAVQVLLLCHAPTSKRVLYYFNPHKLADRWFLKVDYTVEMSNSMTSVARWNLFLPFVLVVLIVYTIGVPVYIGYVLFSERYDLRTPRVMTKYGFLYARFEHGAEYWELHEIFRKNLLIGVVGYLPPTTRAASAILICVIAVACLNFSIPQRNRIIFVVCEACFISTTFKYLGAVLLNAGGTTEEDAAMLGIMLVALDVMTMLGGGIAAIAILLNVGLKAKGSKTKETKKGELTAVTPVDSSGKKLDSSGKKYKDKQGNMTPTMKSELKNWDVE